MNLVELWFSILTRQHLRRGVHRSVSELTWAGAQEPPSAELVSYWQGQQSHNGTEDPKDLPCGVPVYQAGS